MASITTNQGLQFANQNNAGIGAANPVDAIGLSDIGALSAGTTSITAATNKHVNALDATPTIAAQTVTYQATFTPAEIDGVTWTTITLHHNGADNFDEVYGGVDNQSFQYTGLTLTVKIEDEYTSAP